MTPLQPRIHQSLPNLLGSPLRSAVVRNPPISSTPSPSLSCRQQSTNLRVCWALPLPLLLSEIHQSLSYLLGSSLPFVFPSYRCCQRSTNLLRVFSPEVSLLSSAVRDPPISYMSPGVSLSCRQRSTNHSHVFLGLPSFRCCQGSTNLLHVFTMPSS